MHQHHEYVNLHNIILMFAQGNENKIEFLLEWIDFELLGTEMRLVL